MVFKHINTVAEVTFISSNYIKEGIYKEQNRLKRTGQSGEKSRKLSCQKCWLNICTQESELSLTFKHSKLKYPSDCLWNSLNKMRWCPSSCGRSQSRLPSHLSACQSQSPAGAFSPRPSLVRRWAWPTPSDLEKRRRWKTKATNEEMK